MAILSGQIKVPAHICPETAAKVEFRGPKVPWIDPVNDAANDRRKEREGTTTTDEQARALLRAVNGASA